AHRVDAEVHEHADPVGAEHDEGVRVHLDHLAVDRRDHGRLAGVGIDRDARPDHLGGEHRVGGLGEGAHAAGAGGEDVDGRHIKSSMSSAMLSASGPTTTWTTLPDATTPCAPAALRAFSSTSEGFSTSVRRRVMQASI